MCPQHLITLIHSRRRVIVTKCVSIYGFPTITQIDFARVDSHHTLREDLRTETLTQRHWDKLTQVDQNGTKLLLLDKYILLLYWDMKNTLQKRTPEQVAMVHNNYIAI